MVRRPISAFIKTSAFKSFNKYLSKTCRTLKRPQQRRSQWWKWRGLVLWGKKRLVHTTCQVSHRLGCVFHSHLKKKKSLKSSNRLKIRAGYVARDTSLAIVFFQKRSVLLHSSETRAILKKLMFLASFSWLTAHLFQLALVWDFSRSLVSNMLLAQCKSHIRAW